MRSGISGFDKKIILMDYVIIINDYDLKQFMPSLVVFKSNI